MRCGLYGKLPAKRDFIAIGAPRAFLRVWEPWIDAGLAAGHARGGAQAFSEAFNAAPIWRFWLGPALCGEAFLGALMASVDALGRTYPLTLIAAGSRAAPLDPPDVDAHDGWFAAAEEILLDALDEDASPAALLSRFETLDGRGAARGGAAAEAFARLRREAPGAADALTFWWTIGGEGWPPLAHVALRLPSPAAFADMFSRSPGREQARADARPDAAQAAARDPELDEAGASKAAQG